jgi:hypothetical protein
MGKFVAKHKSDPVNACYIENLIYQSLSYIATSILKKHKIVARFVIHDYLRLHMLVYQACGLHVLCNVQKYTLRYLFINHVVANWQFAMLICAI